MVDVVVLVVEQQVTLVIHNQSKLIETKVVDHLVQRQVVEVETKNKVDKVVQLLAQMAKTDHYLKVVMVVKELLVVVEQDFMVVVEVQVIVMLLVLTVQVVEDHHTTDTHKLLQVQPKKALLKKVVEQLFQLMLVEQMKQVLKVQVRVRQAKMAMYSSQVQN